MNVISWNCNMAFRKKAAIIMAHKPDILVVQECEHPDKFMFDGSVKKPEDLLWFGDNQNKGLGIFSYSDYKFKVLDGYSPKFKMVIPILVTGGIYSFTLYAIWANNTADPDGHYIEQVWKALHYYNDQLGDNQTMLVGDFNSNTIWDRKNRAANHSNVVRHLEERGIYSCYHSHYKLEQGKELHPTLYMYRHNNKPYHIDYCFVSKDMLEKLKDLEVGEYNDWVKYSDHVPIIAKFDI